MKTICVKIDFNNLQPWREILLSDLAVIGFDSFVETKTGLECYIAEDKFSNDMLLTLDNYKEHINDYSIETIEDKNWNAEWEANFDPVFVEDKLAIIAPFHQGKYNHQIVIKIQPQMSFGTGHHQTTWLASKKMFELDLKNKDVLDMGTGTGVLAILAEKLGAKYVFAPDIDEWSYKNAIENIAINHCMNIEVALGDDTLLKGKQFDVIIANINKNILFQHFPAYAKSLKKGGIMLNSGFFITDKQDLIDEAKKYGFIFESIDSKDEWALIKFIKN
ncbi:MAG TPA: 50S ribosomal protein L11 methyltransferase [Crocinitomix sp.]|nr:50S ribosomal protein L11 methyltransferase [Crocinitomix sp.]